VPTRATRLLLSLLLAVGAWSLTAGTAQAHTALASSSPADGATVADPLTAVVLDFSGAVRGPEVVVEGPDGADVVTGPPTTAGSVVTVPVAPAAAGAHQVRWSVTSGDGHALSGTVAFTYAPPAPPTTAAPTTAAPTAAVPATQAPTTTAPATATPSEAAAARDDSGPNLLVRVVPVLLGLAVVGGVVLLVRRRQTSGSAGKSR
jgi:methionine-rich copper-binding protein CopC